MPVYDYECEKCGVMEIVHGYYGEIMLCPNCGGKLVRKYSAPLIKFNGPGFYVNDSRSGK